jgi:hypothetical protein
VEDLEETFANLRKVNIKLSPTKCAFGLPSGKLLGFLVSPRGIEANPNKVRAIEEMRSARNLKEMQHLAGCMAALGHFIARSKEKALPFCKIMKCSDKFEWTPEADNAFVELKRYLTSPPILVAPRPRKHLLLYTAATPRSASVVLVAKRENQVIAKERNEAPRLGDPPEEEALLLDLPREGFPTPSTPELPPPGTLQSLQGRRCLPVLPRYISRLLRQHGLA